MVLAALLFGGLVHTAAGFGMALVAMPLLTLVVGPQTATPLLTLVALPLGMTVFYQNRRSFEWREALPIVSTSALGVPAGTYVLTSLPESVVTGFLGVILLGYGAFELFVLPRRLATLLDSEAEVKPLPRNYLGRMLAGFCSGVLGGAYAANGPPLIIYGMLRNWPKEEFKSILQSIFVFNGLCIIGWQATQGLLTRDVGHYVLYGIPGMVIGFLLGTQLDRLLNPARFRRLLIGLVFVLGLALLGRSFFG